jgi:hypothetical protein
VKCLCLRPHTPLACLPLTLIPTSHWIEHTSSHSLLHVAAPYSAPSPLSSKTSPAKGRTGTPTRSLSPLLQPHIPNHIPNHQSVPDALLIRCPRSLSTSPALALFALLAPPRLLALGPPPPRHMTCCSSSAVPANRALPLLGPPWCLTPCIREPPGAPSRWRT